MAEKGIEDQLVEAGNKLLNPPSSVEELLNLLDQVESFLLKVEQSPSKSMQNALSPSRKSLIANELLRHSDMDVKVSVASCISEITRITAPDAPYDDDQMKEVFQLIVVAFEKLSDMSNRSFQKRVSILETVAKVRSCVVMLDLECDTLILEMFEYFMKAIRDFHPDNVFSSMETIMTLVLEESEDINPELLSPLLSRVKKDNEDVLPIARKLGEKVLGNCAAKIKPCLMQMVRSMGMSLNDYSKIVASICQEASDTMERERKDANASGEHLEDEGKLLEKTGSDEPPQVVEELKPEAACPGEVDPIEKKTPNFVSNGSVPTENDDSLIGLDSPKRKSEISQGTTQSTKAEPDSLDISKVVKSEAKPDQSSKEKRGRKPDSLMHSAEASGQSRIDSDKENEDLLDQRKSGSKEADNSLSEDPPLVEATMPSVQGKETPTQVPSPTASPNEGVKTASPSQSLRNGTRIKRDQRGSKKKANIGQSTDSGLPSEHKVDLARDRIEDEAPPSSDIAKKESDENSDIEAKSRRRSSKKAFSVKAKDIIPHPADAVSKNESVATSDSDEKPLKRSGRKIDTRNNDEDESSVKRWGGKPQRGRGKTISEKDVTGEPSNKKIVSSPKLTAKSVNKDQSHPEGTPKAKSKRKRTPVKEETPETQHSVEDSGENLVGSRIKVWWPDDQTFYEGVIDSFDPVKKKHKVSYVDGDTETLALKNERWEFVEGDTVPDEEQSNDIPSPDASAEMPQKKKAKTTSELKAKRLKTDASLKRGKGASTSKPKVEATKSDGKFKDNSPKTASKHKGDTPKTSSKLKDDTQKMGTKSKDVTPKTSTKLKDGTPKTSTKSKDDTPKTSTKSKDVTPKADTRSKDVPKTSTKSKDGKSSTKSKSKTPKSSNKSSSNGPSAKGKLGTSKLQESEESGEAKMLDSAKVQESETKRGKKRQRRFG